MKTSEIKVMVQPEVKKKLKAKADELGLTLTGFIEKISLEPIVFMDSNVKRLVETMGKIFPNSK
jgi:hypothetical protein